MNLGLFLVDTTEFAVVSEMKNVFSAGEEGQLTGFSVFRYTLMTTDTYFVKTDARS